MAREPWDPAANQTAEKIFGASEEQLREIAQSVIGSEPVLAAGAFWPNGASQETMEHGTVGGHKLGAVVGPSIGQVTALAGAFAGRGEAETFEMAKPLITAVTETQIYVVEPPSGNEPARTFKTFDRPTTKVVIKRRGFGRIVVLDDNTSDVHLRLHAEPVKGLARTGPQRSVLAAIARAS